MLTTLRYRDLVPVKQLMMVTLQPMYFLITHKTLLIKSVKCEHAQA